MLRQPQSKTKQSTIILKKRIVSLPSLLLRIIANRGRRVRLFWLLFLAAQSAPKLAERILQTSKGILDVCPLIAPKILGAFPHFIGILQGIGNALHGNNIIYIGEGCFVINIGHALAFTGGLSLIAVQTVQGLAGIVSHNNFTLTDSDIGSDNNINYLFFLF